MVECCHRTIEDIIRKVMTEQTDWLPMLNSVLFSIRCQTHSSTGFSPFRMLYNKDPILPFQYADRLENTVEQNENTCPETDPVTEMISKLEAQRSVVFEKASKKIVKAQEIYSKSYNRKHGVGVKFVVGDKVLKRNKWEDGRKSKLRKKYTGPYEVVAISSTGTNFFLKDKYSHFLKRSVPASHLVWLYENKMYKTDAKSKVITESQLTTQSSDVDGDIDSIDSDQSENLTLTCQCTSTPPLVKQHVPKTSTPIKSQIVIMSSTDMPFSSDDSLILDVGTESNKQDQKVKKSLG